MSCFYITIEKGRKIARPVTSVDEYKAIRNSKTQQELLQRVRSGDENAKRELAQFNYSCLPGEDGRLKGATQMSGTVGMDIDHVAAEEMQTLRDTILAHRTDLRLLLLERSARKSGYHLVFARRTELTQEDNLKWASSIIGVQYDKGAKDITRVFFATGCSEDDLIFLDDTLFDNSPADVETLPATDVQTTFTIATESATTAPPSHSPSGEKEEAVETPTYLGTPYSTIIDKWWEMYNDGQIPCPGNRNTLTFELAMNLRHICDFDRSLLDRVIPDYWATTEAQQTSVHSEKLRCIDSALGEKRTQMPKRLKDVLCAIRVEQLKNETSDYSALEGLDEVLAEDEQFYYKELPKMPMGVKESIDAVGPSLTMPVITAICPCIGTLATGVKLDIHGTKRHLNLISYIAGDYASGKGSIDPVIEAWMHETKIADKIYHQQEDEWRARKRAAKNKAEQPEEPKLPVRCLTLNNTLANLSERLANTQGKHAFSFTAEADTLAQRWKSAMNDFSVIIRLTYDNSPYEREARSADAVNVHVDSVKWNIALCGTPDALYRVVSNYTDGFQSRIAIARTPDNTYAPLIQNPHVMTDRQFERINQVAHLLPLMNGDIELPKLEAQGRKWLEQIRLESMKNDDRVKARQRIRICVTAQRMVCCLMLCKVCETLITKHGFIGAETQLKANPSIWKELLLRAQTPRMLSTYNVIADSLLDNALHFFRTRIESAFSSRDYVSSCSFERSRSGKNDSIFERLDTDFTFEQAFQHSIAIKGNGVSRNSVQQMLKNWRKQGLIEQQLGKNKYHKTST